MCSLIFFNSALITSSSWKIRLSKSASDIIITYLHNYLNITEIHVSRSDTCKHRLRKLRFSRPKPNGSRLPNNTYALWAYVNAPSRGVTREARDSACSSWVDVLLLVMQHTINIRTVHLFRIMNGEQTIKIGNILIVITFITYWITLMYPSSYSFFAVASLYPGWWI